MKISELLTEGGHVFTGKTAPIKRENIESTLAAYFAELKTLFPKKAQLFNTKNFIPLGSVGKKALSGDIDLGISSALLLDKKLSDDSISKWGISPASVQTEFLVLQKRALTATPEQLRMKAFLKVLSKLINAKSKNIQTNEKKITPGTMFTLYPQIGKDANSLNIAVQIDWMVGNLDWLTFSYYSSEYPADSNVKGLHRTQLLLSVFQTANLSFDHVNGVKDKTTGKTVSVSPSQALSILSDRLGFQLAPSEVENFYSLNNLLKNHMTPEQYRETLDRYYNILDSTRADIPDVLQNDWISRKDELGLTGQFLPDSSALRRYV